MALSNWDLMTLSHEGKSMNGKHISPLGVEVSIYKNWIYIEDNKAWQEGAFTKPITMKINSCELVYKDTTILSKTVDNTIYLITWNGYDYLNNVSGMIGIGCYGYSRNEYIGVTMKMIEVLYKYINSKRFIDNNIPQKFKDIDLKKAIRFNMGDSFFNSQLGTDKQCSNIGDAKEPILNKLLKEEDLKISQGKNKN